MAPNESHRVTCRSVDFEGFDHAEIRGVRDQICSAQGPKVDCVWQVDS